LVTLSHNITATSCHTTVPSRLVASRLTEYHCHACRSSLVSVTSSSMAIVYAATPFQWLSHTLPSLATLVFFSVDAILFFPTARHYAVTLLLRHARHAFIVITTG